MTTGPYQQRHGLLGSGIDDHLELVYDVGRWGPQSERAAAWDTRVGDGVAGHWARVGQHEVPAVQLVARRDQGDRAAA